MTTTTKKPTLVLISGAWHVPTTYSKLTKALKTSGYEVHVPALPSAEQVRPPVSDLYTDTIFIREYIEKLINSGHIIVVLMHSYGGQVGTNAFYDLDITSRASKGLSGGVSKLIYMCAFALLKGQSMMTKVREFNQEHLMPLAFDFAEDMSCVSQAPGMLIVGPGEEKEVEEYVGSFVRWNGRGMYQELRNREAWRDIETAYLFTNSDMTVPKEYQVSMVKAMEEEGRSVLTGEVESGHCPNLTATNQVMDFIERVIGGDGP